MTNVLMISAYFWEPPKKYYGIFWMAVNLCRKGHKVVAISSKIHSSKDREILEGVHVYRVPAFYFSRIPWAIAFPAHLWKLMDYLVTRYKIDVVHMQELAFPCTLFAALYCKIRNLPYVATAHGSYFGLGWGLIPDLILDFYMLTAGRLTVKFAEKVSVISKGQIPILRLLGVPKEKIVFTPLGLDTDTSVFEKATEKEKKGARKWLNLQENDFVVGFVGEERRLSWDLRTRCCSLAGVMTWIKSFPPWTCSLIPLWLTVWAEPSLKPWLKECRWFPVMCQGHLA
jgi:hypothetical protein